MELDNINKNIEEEISELRKALDEAEASFKSLSQIEPVFEEDEQVMAEAVEKSIQIYNEKMEQFGSVLEAASSEKSDLQEQKSRIDKMIEALREKYNVRTNESDIEQKAPTNEDLFAESLEKARLAILKDVKKDFEKRYSLEGIQDSETLHKKVIELVSDGIAYAVDTRTRDYYDVLKQIIPQFDQIRAVVLELRSMDLEYEKQLYENIDFKNLTYDALVEKANVMIQSKIRADEETRENAEEDEVKDTMVEENAEETVEPEPESVPLAEEVAEIEPEPLPQQPEAVVDFGLNETHEPEIFQGEIIIPRQIDIENQVKINDNNATTLEKDDETTQMWMNRFKGWHSVTEKISQIAKTKFVEMKSEIMQTIKQYMQNRSKSDTKER